LTTDPPGAKVALVPLDPLDGTLRFDQALQPDGTSPVTLPRVPPGDYLVVVEVPGHGFHEVYRRVPEPGEARPTISDRDFDQTSFRERDGTVELPAITVPKSEVNRGMQFFPGGEFTMGSADYGPSFVPPHTRTVTPFYLDETEVTVAAYRNSPKSLPRELAALSPKDDEAIRFVNYYQAAACAERLGKRLPDEAEYEFAATNAGANRFPWGDASDKVSSWPLGPVGSPAYDRALASPAVCGLFSNVAEWTSSWHAPYPVGVRPPERMARARAQRVVRGAPTQVVEGKAWSPNPGGATVWDARFRNGIDQDKAYPGLGFRCARSFKPRFPQPPGGEKP
jgi:formylglycine-generating enzyme required for sulfatase activity